MNWHVAAELAFVYHFGDFPSRAYRLDPRLPLETWQARPYIFTTARSSEVIALNGGDGVPQILYASFMITGPLIL
jgi:hypothetical protein